MSNFERNNAHGGCFNPARTPSPREDVSAIQQTTLETPRMTEDVKTLRDAAQLLLCINSFLAQKVGGTADRLTATYHALAASQKEVERLKDELAGERTNREIRERRIAKLREEITALRAQLAAAQEDTARLVRLRDAVEVWYNGNDSVLAEAWAEYRAALDAARGEDNG